MPHRLPDESGSRTGPEAGKITGPLGIIAGRGPLPCVLAEAASARGLPLHIVAIRGEAREEIERFPHTWIKWGEIGKMFAALEKNDCGDLVIIGGVNRPDLANVKFDLGALKILPFLLSLGKGGDDHVLSRIVRFFEQKGYRVHGAGDVAPNLLAGEGTLGKVSPPPPVPIPNATSEDLGIEAVKTFLKTAGIRPEALVLDDGSGLSRNDMITADASVTLLTFMSKHRYANVFRDALPIAGVDGTLRNRFKSTPAENNLRAKTGSLSSAASLSGYVTTAAGEKLAFSIMVNNYPRDVDPRAACIDPIALLLASFNDKPETKDTSKNAP